MQWLLGAMVWAFLLYSSLPVYAHDPDMPEVEMSDVRIEADRPVAASSQQFIPDKEYVMQPQGRPAQVLRLIPGLVTVEHSGGAGKADQYFLRGFDADHGTDVAFFADGMPINDGMTLPGGREQSGDDSTPKPTATAIDNTNGHQRLSPLPVVVMVSFPCFTPLTLSKASATLRIAAPLPLATSTSRQ